MTDAEKIKTLRAAVSNLIEFADMHVLATANDKLSDDAH